MIVYQGAKKSCVACSLAWMAMFWHKGTEYDWNVLWNNLNGDDDGLEPKYAMRLARVLGWFRVTVRIPVAFIRFFLWLGFPVVIGVPMNRLFWSGTSYEHPVVWNGDNDEDHMVVATGHDGLGNWHIVGWGNETEQEYRLLDKYYPIKQAYICR